MSPNKSLVKKISSQGYGGKFKFICHIHPSFYPYVETDISYNSTSNNQLLSRMAPLSAGMNIVGAQPWTTIFFLFPKF
jgi:hypothetical protein